MKTKIKILGIALLSLMLMSASSCNRKESADTKLAEQTEESLREANNQIGMPAIVNFQERKLFKQILELRDQESLITYCYLANEMKGEIGQFIGKGIGYGIPAATQFTNPEKVIKFRSGSAYAEQQPSTIPQADPNGLFMPTATTATWYMLLDDKGTPHPVYIEPLIIVSPVKLH